MTEYVMYGGKGGVGKTTCAAATGLKLAREGRETLVVSTDPAHSLSDSFEAELSSQPTEIVDGLSAVEIDPTERIDRYRRMVAALAADFREVGLRLDEADIERLFAAGIAPGSDEAAALDLFVEYVDAGTWDAIVFDTAPTGHTLRLLALPDVLGEALGTTMDVRNQVQGLADSAKRVMYGPVYYALGRRREGRDDFADLRSRMERASDLLRDSELTEFRVVLVPESMAVDESRRLIARLREAGVPVRTLVVNRLLEEIDERCDRCRARRDEQRARLAEVRELFPELELYRLPELHGEAHGVQSLELLGAHLPD
jgi:arsenite-transporting ATPase